MTPQVTEKESDDIVEYGHDNLYPRLLLDLYEQSTTNNAVIFGISQHAFGFGLWPVNRLTNRTTANQWRRLVKQSDIRSALLDFSIFSMCAFRIVMTKDRKRVYAVQHWPMDTLRSGIANDDGIVEKWAYCSDWSNSEKAKNAEFFDVWGVAEDKKEYIAIVKPYSPGKFYYPTVSYNGALLWADLERLVAKFYQNHVKKGFYATTLINFNNGDPESDEERLEIETKVKSKFTGEDSETVIISFNDNKEAQATVENLQINDAPAQFEFLSKETGQKILTGHRVTTPMILGIKDNTGLGNNADELRTGYVLFRDTVVAPMREPIVEFFEDILSFNGAFAPLEFEDLTPPEGVTEARTVTMSRTQTKEATDEQLHEISKFLETVGEEIDESEWEEVLSHEVNYENDDDLNSALRGFEVSLARTVQGKPLETSEQDTTLFKVRYRYAPLKTQSNSREFCKKMVNAGKVYRKEDLINAGERSVNPGFGPEGSNTYSIWLYKGGARCHHYFERVVYLRKSNEKISVNEARKILNELDPEERRSARWEENDSRVARRPVDMPNEGFLRPR